MNRAKELAKNTIVITISRVSTQLISFLLLPLYTSLLSTSEYGMVDFIVTIVQMLVPITTLMIDQGVFRLLLSSKTDEEINSTISSSFYILSVLNIFFILFYLVTLLLFKNNYAFWIIVILIVTSYNNLFLQISRGLKNITDYSISSFICSITIIILNVLCIAFLKLGAVGMLIATFLGNALGLLYIFAKLNLYKYISFKYFKRKIALEQLKYSLPLIPNQLSIWVMNSSDRFIVSYFLGIGANGILAISHKFPAIFMTFYNIFQLSWHETGVIHYNDIDRDDFFSKMFDSIMSIFTTLCILILLFLPLFFNFIVNSLYFESYYNIPIYLVASLFNVAIGTLGVIYVAIKKTSEIAKSTIISAIINIFINIILIKKLGLYAASISTLFGYGITLIYRIIDTKKYIKIKYNKNKILLYLILLITCILTYYINRLNISLINIIIYIPVLVFINKKIIVFFIKFIKKKL